MMDQHRPGSGTKELEIVLTVGETYGAGRVIGEFGCGVGTHEAADGGANHSD